MGRIVHRLRSWLRAEPGAPAGDAARTAPSPEIVQEAVDALADGFVLYDAGDRIVLTNRQYRELWAGNPLSSQIGTRFEDILRAGITYRMVPGTPGEAERWVQERVARHRNPTGAFEQKSGDRWLRISERRLSNGGTVGIHADITGLKAAQAAAEAASRLLRDAVDSISEGFVIYDADDRLVMCNQRYKEIYPNSAAAMVPGTRFEDILHAGLKAHEYADAIAREDAWLVERLRQRRTGSYAIEQRLSDGRWLLVIERRTQDGGIAGMRIDITSLKKAQAEAEGARRRMADFAGVSSDWFWESDAAGNLTYISSSFEAATGVSVASRIGARALVFDRSVDPDNPHWDAHLAKIAAHEPFRDFIMASHLTGVERHMSISAKPLFDDHGTFLGYRGTVRDVTPEIEAQQTLARQKEELMATAEQLRAANAAKSLFLANMSHELRTPLNAILGFSEVMGEAHLGPLDSRYQSYARDIHASGEYLLRLITDVLDASKIEAGQLELSEEPVALAEVIEECRRLVLDKAGHGKVGLEVELPDALPRLRADRLRLKQALLNVLSNAVKFTRPGGRVAVSVGQNHRDGIAIVVSDTGIGMAASDIPKALEPFRQVDAAWARRYEGTGLGLPLAKALIELHGGRLDIESAPGRGTTVRLWLPPRRVIAERNVGAN